ncbi:zinc finger protein 626-like [Cylas formicarius]|uniref:zinc finger protein 626-like n=1 Tax=Cylas formicarius TaxID=197179 RepID=UPI002958957D|nr:zinc finger protein 626-like [Cylas formicarius]
MLKKFYSSSADYSAPRLSGDDVEDVWFACFTCGKRYRHRASLTRHSRYECNKMPQFVCPVCGRRLTQKTTLKTHLQNIHGLKQYVCRRCCKAYKNQTTLSRHVHHECGVSPKYRCSVCGKKFQRRDSLKHHIDRLHLDRLPK